MNPSIKWLNGDGEASSKLFLLDSDSYRLYRVDDRRGRTSAENGESAFDIEQINSCPTSLAGNKQEQEFVRSFALDHTPENRLAIGFTSGRITILSANIDPNAKFLRGEDIREAQKSITSLDWNYNDSARLCAAFERGRGADYAVAVYDLNRTTRNSRELPMAVYETNFSEKLFGISWFREEPNLVLISGARGIRTADIREHGAFQSSLSVQNPLLGVCSEPNHGYRFACYSRNMVFVYDRRYLSSSPLHEVEACTNTKTLNKLAWHPHRLFHLTALAKESANLFNLSISPNAFRHSQKLVNSPSDQSAIYKQQMNSDGALLRAGDTFSAGDDFTYAAHLYSVPGLSKLTAFDWHPSVDGKLALLSVQQDSRPSHGFGFSPKTIHVINLREDVSCDLGPNCEMATSFGQMLKIEEINKFGGNTGEQEAFLTLGSVFKRRVRAGYGYGNTLNPLASLIENSKKVIDADEFASEDLRFCWNWIWMMFQSSDANDIQKQHGTMFAGIKHILKGTKSSSTKKQDDVTYINRIFVNEKRLKILRMCCWPNYSDREECKTRFDEIAEQGGVGGITRAAALALFSVQGSLSKEYLTQLSEYTHSRDFTEAAGHSAEFIDSYQRMAEIVLNVLQRYDGVRVPDYDSVCELLEDDDYLLAIVKFLARRDKIYNRIYNEIFESRMSLKDKLAFASIHMDDDFLATALDKLVDGLLRNRPLSALLVVGLGQLETHRILHRYLDLTGDLQTVSILLVIGNCFRKCKSLQDASLVGIKAAELLETAIESEPKSLTRRSLHCFRDYVELLNRWKLWLPKTFLCSFLRPKNMGMGTEVVDPRPPKTIQAVIACTFCGSPIYPSVAERIENLRVQHTPKINPFPRRIGTNARPRTMSCLCRKPLPKCVICRKHIGSVVEPEAVGGAEQRSDANPAIDHWVVWCSSCNHGGHLAHLRDWFSEYPICAASGCECNCVRRDYQLRDELKSGGEIDPINCR